MCFSGLPQELVEAAGALVRANQSEKMRLLRLKDKPFM